MTSLQRGSLWIRQSSRHAQTSKREPLSPARSPGPRQFHDTIHHQRFRFNCLPSQIQPGREPVFRSILPSIILSPLHNSHSQQFPPSTFHPTCTTFPATLIKVNKCRSESAPLLVQTTRGSHHSHETIIIDRTRNRHHPRHRNAVQVAIPSVLLPSCLL
jgi:hypothetical protein